MKRFYTDVTVAACQGGFGLALDGRAVKTPKRAMLLLPNVALAEAVADEWRAQGGDIAPEAMRLTGLANAAIDHVAPDPAAFALAMARYAESDLLCYRAEHPLDLVERQASAWDPPLRAVEARFDVRFARSTGVQFVSQPPLTIERIGEAYGALDAWVLAAMQPIVSITGSAILGLALLEGLSEAGAVLSAGMLDEHYQIEKWGDDPIALDARESREVAFAAAVRFLAAVKGIDGC